MPKTDRSRAERRFEEAKAAFSRKDFKEAEKIFLELAHEGKEAGPAYCLGEMYFHKKVPSFGTGLSPRENASKWFARSVRLGSMLGAYKLGWILFRDGEVEQGLELLETAARSGYREAQTALGVAYVSKSAGRDLVRARSWLLVGGEKRMVQLIQDIQSMMFAADIVRSDMLCYEIMRSIPEKARR